MVKRTINWINDSGSLGTEEAFFELSETDIHTLEYAYGDLEEYVSKDISDVEERYDFYESLIGLAYKVPNTDGLFISDRAQSETFKNSLAYISFTAELFQNEDLPKAFVKCLLSTHIRKEPLSEDISNKRYLAYSIGRIIGSTLVVLAAVIFVLCCGYCLKNLIELLGR